MEHVKEEMLNLGDPEFVGYVIEKIGVTTDDFKDPVRTERVKDIIQYLKGHPDPDFFIYNSVGSKQIDRVDFLHEYIGLHKNLAELNEKVENLKKQIKVYEQ